MTMNAAPEIEQPPYPRLGYAMFVIALMMFITMLSYLDRQLPSLLVTPIRDALLISDVQMSFLQGGSFAILYALSAPLLGRLVDHHHRRNIMIGGLVVWSATTVLIAFAQTYWQAVLCRMGVGIGEACLMPAAYSLISDYVKPQYRGRAVAIYVASAALGAGASLFVGGVMLRLLPDVASIDLPLVGAIAPWRAMFLFAGIPGLLSAPLLLLVAEVPRREISGRLARSARLPKGAVRQHLRGNARAFTCIFVSQAMIVLVGNALAAWAPTLLIRRFGLTAGDAGMMTGIAIVLSSPWGNLLSGMVSDRWLSAGVRAARFKLVFLCWIVGLPCMLLWPIMPGPLSTTILIGCSMAAVGVGAASAPSAIQDIVPNRMRGQAMALYLLITFLVGLGLGPTAVAVVTDYLFRDDAALGHSLIVVTMIAGSVSLISASLGIAAYERARAGLVD